MRYVTSVKEMGYDGNRWRQGYVDLVEGPWAKQDKIDIKPRLGKNNPYRALYSTAAGRYQLSRRRVKAEHAQYYDVDVVVRYC